MSAYRGELACVRCDYRAAEAEAFGGCPVCGEEGVPANLHPCYRGPESWAPDPDQPGIFRYRTLLPLRAETEAVSLEEGGTPLLRVENLVAGVERLWIKDESRNPTGSFKDRLATVAVTKARETGARTVVVATTGNHGAAAAAYAAAAGMRCVVLTLASVPRTMRVSMQAYGARVVALRTGPERWELMERLVTERGWVPLSGYRQPPVGSNPFGIDGYKTIAYEIYEELAAAPDVVIVPTAYGDGLMGIYRGFRDLVDLGLVRTVPRLVAAEPLGPYARSLETDEDVPRTVPGRSSVAFSTASPFATYQGLHALRASSGRAVVVSDDETIIDAQLAAARRTGIYLEAASAVGVAAVGHLVEEGWLEQGRSVVLIGTSTGLKDVETTAARLAEVPVIPPDPAALDAFLA